MSELKCGPFCGGEAKICNGSNDIVGKQFLIRCKEINCTIRPKTDWHTSLEEAMKHWNTRKPMSNIVEKLEEREKYLENAMKESHENGHKFSEEKAMNERVAIRYAINIVKQEINNGN